MKKKFHTSALIAARLDPAVLEARALALEAMRNRKTPVPPPHVPAAAVPRIAPLPTPVVAPLPGSSAAEPVVAPPMNDARAEVAGLVLLAVNGSEYMYYENEDGANYHRNLKRYYVD